MIPMVSVVVLSIARLMVDAHKILQTLVLGSPPSVLGSLVGVFG